jgi:cardiolipin synthase
MLTSLPNLLTLSRIVAIPLVIACFYVDGPTARWTACALFVVAAITDWFDGYLARSWGQTSNFGRFLDPIADKLLVAAVLLMLAAFHRISPLTVLPAVVIMMREILVSGLREFLAELRVGMPVSRLAKWKTAVQMLALTLLLLGDAGPSQLPVAMAGEISLWLAAALTLFTGYDYLQAGMKHIAAHTPIPPAAPTQAPPAGNPARHPG